MQFNVLKTLETLLTIGAVATATSALFLKKPDVKIVAPVTALALLANRANRWQLEQDTIKVSDNIQQVLGDIEAVEAIVNNLPQQIIDYYTDRLVPVVSTLQSQHRISQDSITSIKETIQEYESLKNELDELRAAFHNRGEVEDIEQITEVLENFKVKLEEKTSLTDFQAGIQELASTDDLTKLQTQLDSLSQEFKATDHDLEISKLAEQFQLLDSQLKVNYVTSNHLADALEELDRSAAINELSQDLNALQRKIAISGNSSQEVKDLKNSLEKCQNRLNSFVTLDELKSIVGDFVTLEHIQEFKVQLRKIAQNISNKPTVDMSQAHIDGIPAQELNQQIRTLIKEELVSVDQPFETKPELELLADIEQRLFKIETQQANGINAQEVRAALKSLSIATSKALQKLQKRIDQVRQQLPMVEQISALAQIEPATMTAELANFVATSGSGLQVNPQLSELASVESEVGYLREEVDRLNERFETRPEKVEIENIKETLAKIGSSETIDRFKNQFSSFFNWKLGQDTKDIVSYEDGANGQGYKFPPMEQTLLINYQESSKVLDEALGALPKTLIISSPFISKQFVYEFGVQEKLIHILKSDPHSRIQITYGDPRHVKTLRQRGKPVTIESLLKEARSGQLEYKNNLEWKYDGAAILTELAYDYPEQVDVNLIGTPFKFLICDYRFAMICNHSFLMPCPTYHSDAVMGVKTTDKNLITILIRILKV
ncbi:MAG: hypothetical protein HC796_01535 [Synechococcaceae cyanobacterium RL_1_2]|nr:hypothetical protein [Synechococcaceae cyanobacterium RL_1_2]